MVELRVEEKQENLKQPARGDAVLRHVDDPSAVGEGKLRSCDFGIKYIVYSTKYKVAIMRLWPGMA